MDATASVPFEGVSGAIDVSIVAFSIVFGVLLALTVMIFAIRVFSRTEAPKPPSAPRPTEPTSTAPVAAAPAPAQSAAPQQKIVAAITGAILAATGGRGRVVSVSPARGEPMARQGSAWRTSGIVALVSGRLVRPWKR